MRKHTPKVALELAVAAFDELVNRFNGKPGVTPARMFGALALRVHGKVFAMRVGDQLVVKLPRARVTAQIASGRGAAFDPGHGKVMKEWIAIAAPTGDWPAFAAEAHTHVAGTPTTRRAKR